jgi:galactose-1-phosphate uridylyltransferase
MEPLGYEQENWNFKETLKDFARTKYRVIRIELDGKLWCYTYTPAEESIALEQVNVYTVDSCKACLEAVEKIILNKEKFNKSK